MIFGFTGLMLLDGWLDGSIGESMQITACVQGSILMVLLATDSDPC